MGGEAIVIGGMIELAKMGLMIWMQASSMAGMTEEQKNRAYHDVAALFNAKDPANLPDV